MVSCFTFRSLSNFALILYIVLKECSSLILLHVTVQFPSTTY